MENCDRVLHIKLLLQHSRYATHTTNDAKMRALPHMANAKSHSATFSSP